jgi:hypothetical protein
MFDRQEDLQYHWSNKQKRQRFLLSTSIHLFMKKNEKKNEMYIFLDENTNYWLQRGASSVLHLAKGDRIWM